MFHYVTGARLCFRSNPKIAYFYTEVDLEVTFELHCRTVKPKCPALMPDVALIKSFLRPPVLFLFPVALFERPNLRKGGRYKHVEPNGLDKRRQEFFKYPSIL